MPPLPGVNHPRFTRISPTHYRMRAPDYQLDTTIHVGHIADILKFDEQVRENGGITNLDTMPLGFTDFSVTWNTGTHVDDPRRISKVFLADTPGSEIIEASDAPVYLKEFHITPTQCGLVNDVVDDSPSAEQAAITQELATIFLKRQHNKRDAIKERRDKRLSIFTAGPSAQHQSTRTANRQASSSTPVITSADFDNSKRKKKAPGHQSSKRGNPASKDSSSTASTSTSTNTCTSATSASAAPVTTAVADTPMEPSAS